MKLKPSYVCPAEIFALLGALGLVLLHAGASPAVLALLEYHADRVWAQPWRVFSAHLVHLSWAHVLVNAAAWVVVVRLFFKELTVLRQLVTLVVAGIVIGCALPLLWPGIGHYRGFSGVLHALYFAGAVLWWGAAWNGTSGAQLPHPHPNPPLEGEGIKTRQAPEDATTRLWLPSRVWLPSLLLVAGTVKVLLEAPWSATMPWADWLGAYVVPQAHGVGALVGALVGVVFAVSHRLQPPHRPTHPGCTDQK